jgi:hypothetical protein
VTEFLNVDLDLVSRYDLTALAGALAPRAQALAPGGAAL